jgi:hypothetical protein
MMLAWELDGAADVFAGAAYLALLPVLIYVCALMQRVFCFS